MDDLHNERWSKDIKSIISCDEIIFKTYKQRIIEITLKSQLFTKDLLMGNTVKSADRLCQHNLPSELIIIKSTIDFKNCKCNLLRLSDKEEIIVYAKKETWLDLKE